MSPGSNTTLLFPSDGLAPFPARQSRTAGLERVPPFGGEQAGWYVDMHGLSLRMAGGEFCVNASRALGFVVCDDDCQNSLWIRAAAPAAPGKRCEQTAAQGWQTPKNLLLAANAPEAAKAKYSGTMKSAFPAGRPVRLHVRGSAPLWR